MPLLVGIAGPVAGRQYTVQGEENILGRGSAAHIRLADAGVSRRHARLIASRGGYEVEDLKSFNGTYVNGRRIQRLRLRDGDEVRICRDVLRFEVSEPKQNKASSELVTFDRDTSESVVGQIDATIISELWEGPDLQASDIEAMSRKLRAIVAVSEAISSTLDPEELFDRVLDQVMTSFPQAEKATILLRNEETGNLELHASKLRYGEEQLPDFAGGLAVSHTVVHQVMAEGHAVVAQPLEVDQKVVQEGTRCRMGAPLIFQRKIKGLVHVEATKTRTVFSEEDLDLLTGIAMQTAVALQVSEFHQTMLKQQQLEQDLQFARRVQQGFLPDRVPEVPGFEFAAHYDPAFHVGGDFYDFIPLDDGRIGIVVGDVSGHGVSAALFMARLSSHIRSFAVSEREPAKVLEKAHDLLADNQDGMFATILYMVVDPVAGTMNISNAGHMPPVVRSFDPGDVRSMDQVTDLVLGVLPDARVSEHMTSLKSGDTVLLYSDGVVEARNEMGQEYGVGRLQWITGQGKSSASELIRRVLKDFDSHVGKQEHNDDITLVAFTALG